MNKVISVVGARPNFMKVAPIHRAFEKYSDKIEHIIVHTGQHYDPNMSDAFFKDLDMPQPRYFMGVGSGTHAEQTARVMVEFERIIKEVRPDLVIVVGDVNSTLACGITAVKEGVMLVHVEGGLRSFDREMPEEINRIVTDSIADYCFVTEESAIKNLSHEGFPNERIFHTGNVMIDSQHYALPKARQSDVLNRLGLSTGEYILCTLHRPSNVDVESQITKLIDIFSDVTRSRKIVFPMHPRTRKNLVNFGLVEKVEAIRNLIIIDPVGYVDFLALMMNSDFVVTDSGGIQEETTALKIPCLTLRTSTERPITCEIGTNTLVSPKAENIRDEMFRMIAAGHVAGSVPELWDGHAAERIAEIIYNMFDNHKSRD
ncbi:MAG: non-hydrolyzing UDP-N-acetylglucosamine 2-epimerase [Candidatus Kapaibacterium sp.]